MARFRAILGLIAGVILILSSAAHSLLGWKKLGSELVSAHVPSELIFGLKVGWQFGGLAMLVFGIITISLFMKRLRGDDASSFPAVVIAVGYLIFSIWALIASKFNPFFYIFIVPAILLLIASPGGHQKN